ncbi:Cupredoxin [Hygrophoropsis aurantiaca]|uniref:Cupredoxin n=1 Tax=Hygrophoropsis aurantiaca TaxID=72124 RepID=A0ACB8AQ93_9AGAM|nr:Cupredoxin [Hygrophoropsis aurantiaca]
MKRISPAMINIALLAIAVLCTAFASAQGTSSTDSDDYEFVIATREVTLAPGLRRTKTVVNGQFPGPQMRVPYASDVRNRVTNLIPTNGSAIHWHGLINNGTPWYDGFASQNQCGIPTNKSFLYDFNTKLQSGTAWWHAHFAVENVDGVFGPLIIEDEPGSFPFHYDEDHTILMTDSYNETSWQLIDYIQTPEPVQELHTDPDPDLGFVCLYDSSNRASCSHDTTGKGFTLNFEAGKTYRLRLVGAANLAPFLFSIDGHEMRLAKSDLTTLDGHSTVKSIFVFSGQRYDVLVTARNDTQKGDTFWLRTTMMACGQQPGEVPNGDIRGIVQYNHSNVTKLPTSTGWNETDQICTGPAPSVLSPRVTDFVDPNPAVTLMINYSLVYDPVLDYLVANVNDQVYNVSATAYPTLFQYHDNPDRQPDGGRNILILDDEHRGKQARILLIGTTAIGAHPFHLHGHDFHILASGVGSYNESVPLNLVNPPRRDTTAIPAGGFTVVQITIDNPGVWAFHCHIGWHLEQGMLAQLVELPHALATMDIPYEATAQCRERDV